MWSVAPYLFMIIQVRNPQNTKKKPDQKKKSLVHRSNQILAEYDSRELLNGKENKENADINQSNNKKGSFLG